MAPARVLGRIKTKRTKEGSNTMRKLRTCSLVMIVLIGPVIPSARAVKSEPARPVMAGIPVDDCSCRAIFEAVSQPGCESSTGCMIELTGGFGNGAQCTPEPECGWIVPAACNAGFSSVTIDCPGDANDKDYGSVTLSGGCGVSDEKSFRCPIGTSVALVLTLDCSPACTAKELEEQ